jgi:hypothetical protein
MEISEQFSIEKCEQAVMAFLEVTDVVKSPRR